MADMSSVPETDSPVSSDIFAVIVLYKMLPGQSPSFRTLINAAKGSFRLQILLVDNTPGGQTVGALPEGVLYEAASHNPGLAEAYNYALTAAAAGGYSWLLTLDQDTSLPTSFLVDMAEVASRYATSPKVAAVVPRIVDQGRLISPFRFIGGAFPSVLPATASGISGPHTSALNSASLFNVNILRSIGGYDERFPLHHSDTRVYQRLDIAGKTIAVAGNVVVPHELSILDREKRMSPERYRHMLEDECDFWDHHMNFFGRMERLIRLVGRLGKGILRGEDPAFRDVTSAEIWRRILTRRTKRIRTRDASDATHTVM